MIRDFDNYDAEKYLKVNVVLKPMVGAEADLPRFFMGKDVPSKPFGEAFKVVSFWHEGGLLVFPMECVQSVEMYLDKPEAVSVGE